MGHRRGIALVRLQDEPGQLRHCCERHEGPALVGQLRKKQLELVSNCLHEQALNAV
jgi:hypothetical protein